LDNHGEPNFGPKEGKMRNKWPVMDQKRSNEGKEGGGTQRGTEKSAKGKKKNIYGNIHWKWFIN